MKKEKAIHLNEFFNRFLQGENHFIVHPHKLLPINLLREQVAARGNITLTKVRKGQYFAVKKFEQSNQDVIAQLKKNMPKKEKLLAINQCSATLLAQRDESYIVRRYSHNFEALHQISHSPESICRMFNFLC